MDFPFLLGLSMVCFTAFFEGDFAFVFDLGDAFASGFWMYLGSKHFALVFFVGATSASGLVVLPLFGFGPSSCETLVFLVVPDEASGSTAFLDVCLVLGCGSLGGVSSASFLSFPFFDPAEV